MNTPDRFLISLKETESLIFNKILVLPYKRTEIKRRSKDYSVKIEVDKKLILFNNNKWIILFSSIQKFEIPENDLNLFKNHYRLPLGFISIKKVEVRDSKSINEEIPYEKNEQENKQNGYKLLRNGLISSFISMLNKDNLFSKYKELYKLIENDKLIIEIIRPLLSIGDFQRQEVKGNYSLGLERLVASIVNIGKAIQTINVEVLELGLHVCFKNAAVSISGNPPGGSRCVEYLYMNL